MEEYMHFLTGERRTKASILESVARLNNKSAGVEWSESVPLVKGQWYRVVWEKNAIRHAVERGNWRVLS